MASVYPQLIIDSTIRKLLEFLRTELTNNTPIHETVLHQLFGDVARFRRDYFDEAVDLFKRDQDHIRPIDTRLHFDMERVAIPTIHITLPSDSEESSGIGNHEGVCPPASVNYGQDEKSVFRRYFRGSFEIVFTSDNEREVFIMYEVIRAALISSVTHLALSGLITPSFGGQDITINPALMPPHIFMRSLTMSTIYPLEITDIDSIHRKISHIYINQNSNTQDCG